MGQIGPRSVRTNDFKDLFDRLPARVQKTAINRYVNYFASDPFHSLLERHILYDTLGAPTRSIAVTIAYGYRAVGVFDEETQAYIWYWCGSHAAYDAQFRKGR